MWLPESESTMSLSWPTLSAKLALSKAGCIFPRANEPRSPPRCALEQSLYLEASASKARRVSSLAPPPSVRICSRNAVRSLCASSCAQQQAKGPMSTAAETR